MKKLSLCLLALVTPVILGGLGPRTNFNDRILAAHNRERSAGGISPLAWNTRLELDARSYAQHLSRTGRFEHSKDAPGAEVQGENLWGGTPGHYQPENMVGLWIAEKRHFRQGVFPQVSRTGNVMDVGHYTQLMWRNTTEVGCAVSAIGREEILVCRYRGPGNVIGERPF